MRCGFGGGGGGGGRGGTGREDILSSQLTTLELQYVSPKLLACKDLELAVPGTYEPNQDIVKIRSVSHTLNVITSKQRPRKLVIHGKCGGEHLECMISVVGSIWNAR